MTIQRVPGRRRGVGALECVAPERGLALCWGNQPTRSMSQHPRDVTSFDEMLRDAIAGHYEHSTSGARTNITPDAFVLARFIHELTAELGAIRQMLETDRRRGV